MRRSILQMEEPRFQGAKRIVQVGQSLLFARVSVLTHFNACGFSGLPLTCMLKQISLWEALPPCLLGESNDDYTCHIGQCKYRINQQKQWLASSDSMMSQSKRPQASSTRKAKQLCVSAVRQAGSTATVKSEN